MRKMPRQKIPGFAIRGTHSIARLQKPDPLPKWTAMSLQFDHIFASKCAGAAKIQLQCRFQNLFIQPERNMGELASRRDPVTADIVGNSGTGHPSGLNHQHDNHAPGAGGMGYDSIGEDFIHN